MSTLIIDQCVAQGVPFAREYGGTLANPFVWWSAGFADVLCAWTDRDSSSCWGVFSAESADRCGQSEDALRTEMLDLVVVDGQARGIITRDLVTGKIERYAAHAVILATGGYGNIFYLSTNAIGCNVTATYRAYKRGARCLRIRALRRFTRPAFPSQVSISRS